jgi:hypothetical protein
MGDVLDMGTNSFTVETWFKTDVTVGYNNIVRKGVTMGATPSNCGYGLRLNNAGRLQAFISDGSEAIFDGTTDLVISEWYHAAMVVNRDDNTFKLFLNGIEENSMDITGIGSIDVNSYFEIGDNMWIDTGQHGHHWDGLIDEVRVWNVALSEIEIQSNYNTELSGSETGLLSYWNFNTGSGTTLTDQTSNGNNGTINGATWSSEVPSTTGDDLDYQNNASQLIISWSGSDGGSGISTYEYA